jgi:flavin reductase (DIM6/NTAB) family NADH-FMN oxidoreductase RutF
MTTHPGTLAGGTTTIDPASGDPGQAPLAPSKAWVVGADDPRQIAGIVKASVVPRPIAWVSTRAADGTANLAPHSYFMVLADQPPVLGFVSSGVKDTLRNIRETGEFVVNILGDDLAGPMNVTAAAFPPEEDEFRWAGVTAEPGVLTGAPLVAEAPVAFECRFREERDFGGEGHPSYLVAGEVLRVRVHDRVRDEHHVLPGPLAAVARMGGATTYSRTTDRFDLERPRWDADRGGLAD